MKESATFLRFYESSLGAYTYLNSPRTREPEVPRKPPELSRERSEHLGIENLAAE